MATKTYKVSDLRRIIKESSNEFKPIMGKGVENDNKKINDKAYKDASNSTKNYDGGVKGKNKKSSYPYTDNLGMQDLEYNNMNQNFKDNVKSQLKGYVSKDAEDKHKNDPKGNYENNEIEGMEERRKKMKNGKNIAKEIGLTSREIDKKNFENQTSSVFENKMTRIKFKNTTFLTENHMISKIPDDLKVEGKKFMVTDKSNHEYVVEWHKDEPSIINKTKINEQKDRIKHLFNYKRENSNTTNDLRLNEENKITDILGKARSLMK